jgi:hypothetical protein
LTDREVAEQRGLSPRTIEDHKRKILEIFGADMESRGYGYAGLMRELGVGPGDIVNDDAAHRPNRGAIARLMPWLRPRRRNDEPTSTPRPHSARSRSRDQHDAS